MISLADDFGIELEIRLHVDASAALGILQRQGVGRVRHLDVGVLWLQEQQLRRLIELTKVLGTRNPADLMTNLCNNDFLAPAKLCFYSRHLFVFLCPRNLLNMIAPSIC